jgi:hypothetical protein
MREIGVIGLLNIRFSEYTLYCNSRTSDRIPERSEYGNLMTQHHHEHDDPATTEMWYQTRIYGHKDMPSSLLPGGTRCGMCLISLSGVGGALMKAFRGRTASRKNPAMCNY